jgi:hypothetical protein
MEIGRSLPIARIERPGFAGADRVETAADVLAEIFASQCTEVVLLSPTRLNRCGRRTRVILERADMGCGPTEVLRVS